MIARLLFSRKCWSTIEAVVIEARSNILYRYIAARVSVLNTGRLDRFWKARMCWFMQEEVFVEGTKNEADN
jgi:hypothetical protein